MYAKASWGCRISGSSLGDVVLLVLLLYSIYLSHDVCLYIHDDGTWGIEGDRGGDAGR